MLKLRALEGATASWILTTLFFLSGASSLAYQTIWFRRFATLWGSSALAMAAVVTSFLIGLALGAHLFGRFARSGRSSLAAYGVVEIGIGLWALLLPFYLQWLDRVSIGQALHHLPHSPLYVMRMMITLALIGPACILMGGTLPLLVAAVRTTGSTAKTTAWLYGSNTLGASMGCYVTGFHLLPGLGTAFTNTTMVIVNALIGVAALATAGLFPANFLSVRNDELEAGPIVPFSDRRSHRIVYLIATLTGAAALILEMLWARQLALVAGGSTYTFTATLVTLLFGIGLGGLVYHWADPFRSRFDEVQAGIWTIAFICLALTAAQLTLPTIARLMGYVGHLRASLLLNGVFCSMSATVLLLAPAIGMGILFPTLVSMLARSGKAPASTVGMLAGWNTLGAAVGSSITSVALIPLFGTAGTAGVTIVLYVGAMALLLVHEKAHTAIRLGGLALAGGCLCFILDAAHAPLSTNLGMYLYGPNIAAAQKLLFFREGPSCNVLVTESPNGERNVRVNGKTDASSTGDQQMQLGAAYFSMFIRPNATRLCVIGLGSGATSGAALLFPGTSVVCCEIEPAMAEAARYFERINHSPWTSPRFSIAYDDARAYLQSTHETFDLIISEPSNPWIAGVSSLYTSEFYDTVRKRLASGGMLVQWVQAYRLTRREFTLVIRTLAEKFSQVCLIAVNDSDLLVLASDSRIVPDMATIDKSQSHVDAIKAINDDLTTHFNTSSVKSLLLTHLLLDREGLAGLISASGEETINTDMNMRLEFDAPRRLFGREIEASSRISTAINRALKAEWFESCIKSWQCSVEQAPPMAALVNRFLQELDGDEAKRMVELCLELDSEQPYFRMAGRIVGIDSSGGSAQNESDRAALTRMAEDANQLAVALMRSGRTRDATMVFRTVVEWFPDSASGWMNLAFAYSEGKEKEQAFNAFDRASALDPLNPQVRQSRSRFNRKQQSITANSR